MRVIARNNLTLKDVPSLLRSELKNGLSFPNPKWVENEKHGYWNGETPKTVKLYEQDGDDLLIPRGFVNQLIALCQKHGVAPIIDDATRSLDPVEFEFHGTLRPYQAEALQDILKRRFGTLPAPTGSGKTIIALAVIAARKQPALVITHTKELQSQWVSRIESFLEIPEEEIGRIGGGKKPFIGKKVTVGLVQSLYKVGDEVSPYIGFLVVDECHRCPSRTFVEAVTAFDSRYMLGLSATPWRRDGLSRLIFFHLGDVVHEIKKDDLIETGDVLQAEVILRETDFNPWHDASTEYSKMLSELTEDPERNALIARDVSHEARNGAGICLVLSDRKVHCEVLRGLIFQQGVRADVLTGELSKKKRVGVVEDLNAGQVSVLIATGQLVGEGFDCAGLTTLFLATPIRFDGRVLQYLGRVLRPGPGKDKAIIYDYVDIEVPVLKTSAKARERVYD